MVLIVQIFKHIRVILHLILAVQLNPALNLRLQIYHSSQAVMTNRVSHLEGCYLKFQMGYNKKIGSSQR